MKALASTGMVAYFVIIPLGCWEFIQGHNSENLVWPEPSTATNPSEPLWEILECHMRVRINRVQSTIELLHSLKKEWCNIPPDINQYVVQSGSDTHLEIWVADY